MSRKSLGFRKDSDVLGETRCCVAINRLDRRPSHKVENRESGVEASRSTRWQHVISTGHVVAERNRARHAQKNRPRVSRAGRRQCRIATCQEQMLRSKGVGKIDRRIHGVSSEQRTTSTQRGADYFSARLWQEAV